jgi:hypothetical protein
MLAKFTKIIITSTEAYKIQFKDKIATADDKVGNVSGDQMFLLPNNAGIYLNEKNYQIA